MDWKKIINRHWSGIFGAFLFLFGVPGLVEDAVTWRKWTGSMNPYWFGVVAGVGGTLMTLWLVVNVSAHGKTILHALRRMFRNNRNVPETKMSIPE